MTRLEDQTKLTSRMSDNNKISGPGSLGPVVSKLKTSLVNDLLKFQI